MKVHLWLLFPGLLTVGQFAYASSVSLAAKPLKVPVGGTIQVAFVLAEGATMIDFAGPWEVFQDVMVTKDGKSPISGDQINMNDHRMPFKLYTVAEKKEIIRASGGLQILPDYTFEDAPAPNVVVIPAQSRRSSTKRAEWLKKVSQTADVTFSVCTGAFILADAGLLDGKKATTHHLYQSTFQEKFPKVRLERGVRFVEEEKISSAAGLSSGIDLALRVVARYFGEDIAQATANYMEYHSDLWRQPKVQ